MKQEGYSYLVNVIRDNFLRSCRDVLNWIINIEIGHFKIDNYALLEK
jgi:hypothetical protein